MFSILKERLVSVAIIIGIVVAAWFIFNNYQTNVVMAAEGPFPLEGYAWTDTIGWISFNGDVEVLSNRNISGWGWSDNIGWVKFGGIGNGCPNSSGNCGARIISDGGTGWEMTGWARALAHSDPQAGGWDGWISLNCENTGDCDTSSDYAVRIDENGYFDYSNSYAWGDMVVGWTSFKYVTLNNLCTSNVINSCSADTSRKTTTDIWCKDTTEDVDCAASGEVCIAETGVCGERVELTGTFEVSPAIVRSGGDITAEWAVTGASSCEIQIGRGVLHENLVAGDSPYTGLPGPTSQTIYTLTCEGSEIGSSTVNVLPTIYE